VTAFEPRLGREHLFDQQVPHDHRGGAIPIRFGELNPALGQREAQVMIDERAKELAAAIVYGRKGHAELIPSNSSIKIPCASTREATDPSGAGPSGVARVCQNRARRYKVLPHEHQ
jgi:hypothetical protein